MNTNNTQSNTEQPTLPFPEPVLSETKVSNEPSLAEMRAENEKLKEKLRLRDAHDDLTHKLKKAGARTPKLLFEAAKHALKFTADGLLDNAGELIDDLKGRFPEQFGHETSVTPHISIDAGAARGHRPTLTREMLAKMKPEQIAQLDWADVRRVLSN